MDINKIELNGILDRAPEAKSLSSGKDLTTLLVRVVDRWTSRDGQQGERVSVVPVTVWGKLGTALMGRARAGDRVSVEGRLSSREYERDGQRRYFTEVVANFVELPDEAATEHPPRSTGQQREIDYREPPRSKHTTRRANLHDDPF